MKRKLICSNWDLALYFKSALYIVTLFLSINSFSEVLIRPEASLKEQFGKGIEISKQNILLKSAEKQTLSDLAKTAIEPNIFTVYRVYEQGQQVGFAVLDHQNIRTKSGTFLISLDKTGELKRIEVIAFYEPKEYLPQKHWLRTLTDQKVAHPVVLGRGITGITGATLSSEAVIRSVNLAKALWELKFSRPSALETAG